ncbi:hypothetical protein GCM10017714_22090 [Curtobacterium pusillum]
MGEGTRQRRRMPAVGTILIGTVSGQGLVIAISPLLTRMYGPSDFGALAVLTAVSSVVGAFATFGVDRAVIVARTSGAVRHLIRVGATGAALIALLMGVVVWAGRAWLADLFAAPSLGELWWLFPSTSFAISLQRIFSAAITRQRRYRSIAVRNGLQGASQSLCNVLLAPLGPIGLLGGLLAGRLAGVLGLVRGASRPVPEEHSVRLATTLRDHRRFLLVTPWSAAVNVLGQQAPSIILAMSLGSTAAGFVALTMRVLGAPVGMIADAVAQWSAGAMGHRIRTGAPLATLVRRTVVRSALGALVAALLVVGLAPPTFTTVFGEQWADAGKYAQVLAPAFALQVVASPVTQLLSLLGRQTLQLGWDVGRLVLTSGSVLLATLVSYEPMVAVTALAAAMILAYGTVLVLVFTAVRRATPAASDIPAGAQETLSV